MTTSAPAKPSPGADVLVASGLAEAFEQIDRRAREIAEKHGVTEKKSGAVGCVSGRV